MKNNGLTWFERMAETMFSDRFQAKAIIGIFGIFGVICLIGAFYNPAQLLIFGISVAMVICGFSELKKCKKYENEQKGTGKPGTKNG